MVQLFYYENRGKCCRKILSYQGYPSKILLFPDEGWATSATNAHWILKAPWWSKTRCKVIEVSGARRLKTSAKMIDIGNGTMCIKGHFNNCTEPDFQLILTSNVSNSDFQLGYTMTGTLERGDRSKGKLYFTHYAMIKRKDMC